MIPQQASAPRGAPRAAKVVRSGAWRALMDSFRHAFRGLVDTAIHQRNMRIHVVAGILVALLASAVPLGIAEKIALALCVFLVLSAEVANSALEAMIDVAAQDWHERARVAKDAGAGAVLVLAAGSVVVLAMVLVHDWPSIASAWPVVARQAACGLPLAGLAAALLTPFPRPAAADAALAVAGAALLAVLVTFTASLAFTALATLLFAVSAKAAFRRREE